MSASPQFLVCVQEVVAAQGRLVGELGRVEKVRGEVTDLLRSLDTALSGAQVTIDTVDTRHRAGRGINRLD